MITETKLDDSFPEQQFHIEDLNIGLFRMVLFRIITIYIR